MLTNSELNFAQIQPGMLGIKPTITEPSSAGELDGELLKIAEDVLGSAKYTVTAVAAEPNAQLKPGTLGADFQTAFKSVSAELRNNATVQATELVKIPLAARKFEFGRYGELPVQAVLNQDFRDLSQGLAPLKIDSKRLGLTKSEISIPISQIERTDRGLLFPQVNLPGGMADFESAMQESESNASKSGVFDRDRFAQVWGEVHEGDLYSGMNTADNDFEAQTTTNKLGLYLRKIKCEDETNPELWGDDEIALAGISTDEDGDTKKIAEEFIGSGFKDGKEKSYSNKLYHWFSMAEGKYFPKKYGVTFILAEKDDGGFSAFLNRVWDTIRDLVKDAIEKAITAAGGAVGAAFGNPAIGVAIGNAIGKVVGWVVDRFVDWIIKLFKDDIFKPQTAWINIPSVNARWYYPDGRWGNPWSPVRSFKFSGFGGRYLLQYQWRIYA